MNVYSDDILLIDLTKERVGLKLERWRQAVEDRGQNYSEQRQNTFGWKEKKGREQ